MSETTTNKESVEKQTLSYSSSVLIGNCEQKYVHYKVKKTARDFAFDFSRALIVGKVVHQVSEDLLHMPAKNRDELNKVVSKNLIPFEKQDPSALTYFPLAYAMSENYLQFHKDSGLRVVKCEYEIKTDKFLGYIDIILADDNGDFYISDLKTKSRFNVEKDGPLLKRDTQLHLYGDYHEQIAKEFGLKNFKGYLYRVVKTPLIRQRRGEDRVDFVERLRDSVDIIEVFVPHKQEVIDEVRENFQAKLDIKKELENGRKPNKNFNECVNMYGSVCAWYSQCHGKPHHEQMSEVMSRSNLDGKSMKDAYLIHEINSTIDEFAGVEEEMPDI